MVVDVVDTARPCVVTHRDAWDVIAGEVLVRTFAIAVVALENAEDDTMDVLLGMVRVAGEELVGTTEIGPEVCVAERDEMEEDRPHRVGHGSASAEDHQMCLVQSIAAD